MKKRTTNNPRGRNKNVDEDRSKKSGFKTAGSFHKGSGKPGAKRGESKPIGDKPKRSGKSAPKRSMDGKIRLNRFLAQAGICSRREADVLIETGVVEVNKKIVTELGIRIDPQVDVVHYGGEKIKVEGYQYVLLNKPKDFITTSKDPQNRKTVMELISNACIERIYPVGRLDRNTLGLLLFTNDGMLAEKLTHPRNEINKTYQIEVDQTIQGGHMKLMQEGVELDDGFAKVDSIDYADNGTNKSGAVITLHSGRNRIVRRIFEHFDYKVKKLDRIQFASLTKKGLQRGTWRHLTAEEVAFLKSM
ncbi:rRNA pseudouridine synthase [Flavobacteriales bacterium]|nr:rRNA pseudouridine synthase [Flavobacteriales bacterium]